MTTSVIKNKRPTVSSKRMLDILFKITGIPWDWYWGDPECLPIEGKWQLMPNTPNDEGEFWDFHLWKRRQWFNSKYEAFAYLLESWFIYKSEIPSQQKERT